MGSWYVQWIGLRELLQENPIFNGKIYGFRLRCSLKPIHWTSEWFWVAFRHTMKLWNSMIHQPCCLLFVLLDVPSLQVDGPTRTPGPNPVLKLFWRGPGPSEIAWLVTTLSKSKDTLVPSSNSIFNSLLLEMPIYLRLRLIYLLYKRWWFSTAMLLC